MNELMQNALEFIASGEDNLLKKRYNASVSDFFKAIVTLCDYLIYKDMKFLPKNHNERFEFLKNYFNEIYLKVFSLFQLYRDSYNLRLKKEDALKLRDLAHELRRTAENKKSI